MAFLKDVNIKIELKLLGMELFIQTICKNTNRILVFNQNIIVHTFLFQLYKILKYII